MTVDNSGNMDVAIKRLHILKIGCFEHTLILADQKIYKMTSIDKWAARISSRRVVQEILNVQNSLVILTETTLFPPLSLVICGISTF